MIGRNSGRSAVAAAAYRAGEKLTNEYDGVTHDFTKKNWVEYTEIILPENAPKEFISRSTLWNAVEKAEKSKDAQLAREVEVALPKELDQEQQIEIIRLYVQNNFVAHGMCADIAIHNPPLTNDRHQPIDDNGCPTNDVSKMQFINPHAHILLTARPINEQGRWEAKTEKEYICRKGKEEKGFTSSEYKKAIVDGWEKQYQFTDGKKKIWLTAEEGKKRKFERVSRAPKSSPYGRRNKTVEYWNSKDRIFDWRQNWENIVNDKFKSINLDTRIDSRNFKDQGRSDEIPTIHMGTVAINLEKRAERELQEGKREAEIIRSEIGDMNREIMKHNAMVIYLRHRLNEVVQEARTITDDMIKNLARKAESIRAGIIRCIYQNHILIDQLRKIESFIIPEEHKISRFEEEIKKVIASDKESKYKVQQLQLEMKKCSPIYVKRKLQLKQKIANEQEKIENREEYLFGIARQYKISSIDILLEMKTNLYRMQKEYSKLNNTISTIKNSQGKMLEEYKSIIGAISGEEKTKYDLYAQSYWKETEEKVKDELMNIDPDFNEIVYKRSVFEFDKNFDNQNKKEKKCRK